VDVIAKNGIRWGGTDIETTTLILVVDIIAGNRVMRYRIVPTLIKFHTRRIIAGGGSHDMDR
ncbi:unnamed protein product, partial [marine sediment metagenome]